MSFFRGFEDGPKYRGGDSDSKLTLLSVVKGICCLLLLALALWLNALSGYHGG